MSASLPLRTSSRLGLVLLVLLFPVAVSAQVEMSDETYELNEQAAAASARGEHERAIRLYRETVAAQGLNISHLNLGRAYAKAGECELARRAYDKVPDAPAVDSVPRDKILEVLYKYRLELDEQCKEQEAAEEEEEKEVEVEPIKKPPVTPEREPNILAYSLVGVGVAGVATFAILDLTVLRKKREALEAQQGEGRTEYDEMRADFNVWRAVNIGVLGVGVAAAATGAFLLLRADEPSRTALVPWFSSQGGGVAWSARF